jgi:hypothetical protein
MKETCSICQTEVYTDTVFLHQASCAKRKMLELVIRELEKARRERRIFNTVCQVINQARVKQFSDYLSL